MTNQTQIPVTGRTVAIAVNQSKAYTDVLVAHLRQELQVTTYHEKRHLARVKITVHLSLLAVGIVLVTLVSFPPLTIPFINGVPALAIELADRFFGIT